MRNLRTAAALVLLALAFSLAAPAAFAGDAPRPASLQARPAQTRSGGVLESLWSLVTRAFSAQASSTAAVCHAGDEGCRIDPWGVTANTDEGCGMDPLGRCLPDH
ncbi:MAG TPA: hypothetical protein VLV54_08365 [Thermoanaerobaculia bacterium]|nr:hypothetical protein [Thermoanaerobaculia bacterium]